VTKLMQAASPQLITSIGRGGRRDPNQPYLDAIARDSGASVFQLLHTQLEPVFRYDRASIQPA
jgi:hypothetical protein